MLDRLPPPEIRGSMYSGRDKSWRSDEFGAVHEGRVGVVLEDGSEPAPTVIASNSGSSFRTSTDWKLYKAPGYGLTPQAFALRGACSCGWRGQTVYPVDWAACAEGTKDPDTSACYADWAGHIADVAAAAIPVPADVAALLEQLDGRLEELADESPLAALRALGTVERMARRVGWRAGYAAFMDADAGTNAQPDDDRAEGEATGGVGPTGWEALSRALGMPDVDAAKHIRTYGPW